jgi:general secretion pathway protein G
MYGTSPVFSQCGNQVRLILKWFLDVRERVFWIYNPQDCGQTLLLKGRTQAATKVSNKVSQQVHRKNSGGRGFTLVELMFAIAIIAVLSAIAVPVYNGHIDKAKNTTAISEIYSIQVCIERYYTETFQYPATLADIAPCLPNKGIDPWGNDYVYLNIIDADKGIKGKVRKDHKENPINTLYDLYSMGKNGASKTQLDQKDSVDDIVLARDGGFVGLASDY